MTGSPLSLDSLLPEAAGPEDRRAEVFALLALGVLDAIEAGALSPESARSHFFNAANCLFTRRTLNLPEVEEVMSRGVELPDLFDALPADTAAGEACAEVTLMRASCLRILTANRLVA